MVDQIPPSTTNSKMTPNPMTPWNQVGCRDQENKKPIGSPALNHPHTHTHTPGQCLRIHPIPSHPIPGPHPWGRSQPRNSTKRSPARSITLVGFMKTVHHLGSFCWGSTEGCGFFFKFWWFEKINKSYKELQKSYVESLFCSSMAQNCGRQNLSRWIHNKGWEMFKLLWCVQVMFFCTWMRTRTIACAECNKSPKQLASNPLHRWNSMMKMKRSKLKCLRISYPWRSKEKPRYSQK